MKTSDAYLVVSLNHREDINKENIDKMINALLTCETLTYAGFKCKVHEIKIKEEGSKQLGSYRITALAYLCLVENYEIN